MKISTYRPFFNLKALNDDFFNFPSFEKNGVFAPLVNTREDDNGYYIEVDLPGVRKEDVDIELDKNMLTISGERKFKNEKKENGYQRTESDFGKFERSFTINTDIDTDKITAEQKDGILEIFIPKVEAKESKKIAIK